MKPDIEVDLTRSPAGESDPILAAALRELRKHPPRR